MEGHQRGTSARTAHDPRRPSLERPSLFAGPEDDTTDADGLRGVRILSTLESQERGKGAPSRRAPPSRARATGHAARWPGAQGLLWVLVVAGLASAGAALWWAAPRGADAAGDAAAQRPPHATPHPRPSAHATSSAAETEALAASAATAQRTASAANATPLAALIENTPPAAGPGVLAIAPLGSASSPPTVKAPTPAKARPAHQARNEPRANKRQAQAADTSATRKGTEARSVPGKEKQKRAAAQADRDVELLEAVMTHTERRQRP